MSSAALKLAQGVPSLRAFPIPAHSLHDGRGRRTRVGWRGRLRLGTGSAHNASPSTESQKQTIGSLLKTTLRKGDEWYLIDSRWFKQWKKYVGFDSWTCTMLGDVSCFFTLKEHLIDELDYVLVPTEAWNKLVSWYGCLGGVVEHGMLFKHCKVENDNMDNVVTRHFSKADTIDEDTVQYPSEKETRLWNKYMSNTYEQLNKPDSTVQDAGLFQGQVLVISAKNEDGTWPRQASHPK
uniref:ubiquitinyl hydrolase 1 n=1 Tax=Seriola dumerili TaxID=41447 RepID=A0A3B4UFE0_SERDU